MDLSLAPADLAFRDEVKAFLAENSRPNCGRRPAGRQVSLPRPTSTDAGTRCSTSALHHRPAEGTWRHGLECRAALHFRHRMRRSRNAVAARNGFADVRTRIDAFRHARAKGVPSAAGSWARTLLVPRLLRAGIRFGFGEFAMPRGARRRSLHHQRHQDLDDPRAFRQLDVRAGAHRQLGQAANRNDVCGSADVDAGPHRSADHHHVG